MGCGGGANLYAIKQEYPHADIGGIDWSAALITEAQKILPKASILQVGEATDVYISNKGSDMILSDMCFIYLNGKEFKKAIKEAHRVARVGAIFCEFHSKSWWKRLLLRFNFGYFAHDYQKALKKEGFHDIEVYKMTEEDWPGGNPQKDYGYIISARS